MTKIDENNDGFVIRHIPLLEWVIGILLIFVGAFLILWLIIANFLNAEFLFRADLKNRIEMILFYLVAIAWIIPVVFEINPIKIIRKPLISLTVSRITSSVEIQHQRVYGKQIERFYFPQVEKFKSYQKNKKHFLALILANQTEIKLKIRIGKEIKPATLVRKLNKLIKTSKVKEFSK